MPGALAGATVPSPIGDAAWFLAGRSYGYRILRLLSGISISPDSCVSQGETFIARRGGASLLAAKSLPGISVVAPPAAGALGMTLAAFVLFEVRRIRGARPIELGRIPKLFDELPREREIVLYCNCPNDVSAVSAARMLAERGLTRVRPLAGGVAAWVTAGHAIESHTAPGTAAQRQPS